MDIKKCRVTVLGLSKRDVSCFSKLRPSTLAMVPAVVLLAAVLTRTHVILACLVLLFQCSGLASFAPLQSASLSAPEAYPTLQPLRAALIGRAWKAFRPGQGSGMHQLFGFESILAGCAERKHCKENLHQPLSPQFISTSH